MDFKGPPPEAWDRVAANYQFFAPSFTSLHAFDLLSSMADKIRSAKTILDIACGTGAVSLAYAKMFPKGIPGQTIIMTDYSSEMVSIAKQEVWSRLPSDFQTKLHFRREDATNLSSIPDNSVDVVVSCFGVFLVPQQELALNEIKRALKPEGIFGTTAWTDLPSEMSFGVHGFGAPFQSSVGEAFNKLRDSNSNEKSPPWTAWGDPDVVRKICTEASFSNVKIHRTIHSTTFSNVDKMWDAVSKTCPFVDVSEMDPDKAKEVRNALIDSVGVESENDIVYVVMSSNIIVASV